jgi:hypothetical protein
VDDLQRFLIDVRDLWNKVQVQTAAGTNFSLAESAQKKFERSAAARMSELERERGVRAENVIADFNERGREILVTLSRIQFQIRANPDLADLERRREVVNRLVGLISRVNRERGELAIRGLLLARWGLQSRLEYDVKAQLQPVYGLIHLKNEYESHAQVVLNTLNELQAKVGGTADDDSVSGLIRQVQEIENLPGSRSVTSVQAIWQLVLDAFE